MARRHTPCCIALVNGTFVLGILTVLGGVTALTFALGWYNLGPEMRNPNIWSRTQCRITASRLDTSSNPYSPQHRYRAEFSVNFPLPNNKTFLGGTAIVTLDTSWVSQAEAQKDLANYPVKKVAPCFCPNPCNEYLHPEDWTISKFCLFQFTDADEAKLVFYYNCWFYAGITALSVAAFLMIVPSFFWYRTKCFRRSFRWCADSGRDPQYAPLQPTPGVALEPTV